MLFAGIDHPAIACENVSRQMDWYCRNLGMRVIATDGKTPAGAALVGYDETAGRGAVIELMSVKDAGPAPSAFARFQPGLRHVALRVTDFRLAREQLLKAGVEFLSEPVTAMGGGKIVSFRDPEGNELQIVEREFREEK